jgi:hypothetical protein
MNWSWLTDPISKLFGGSGGSTPSWGTDQSTNVQAAPGMAAAGYQVAPGIVEQTPGAAAAAQTGGSGWQDKLASALKGAGGGKDVNTSGSNVKQAQAQPGQATGVGRGGQPSSLDQLVQLLQQRANAYMPATATNPGQVQSQKPSTGGLLGF